MKLTAKSKGYVERVLLDVLEKENDLITYVVSDNDLKVLEYVVTQAIKQLKEQ